MNILTTRGQKSLEYEARMFEILRGMGVNILETPKDEPADVDGFFYKEEITGVFEGKSRDLTLEQLKSFGTWIISFSKIERGKTLANSLRVPFYGLLYLIPEDIVLYWQITDKEGNIIIPVDLRWTETKKNINGGKVMRTNAYLPIKYAKQLKK